MLNRKIFVVVAAICTAVLLTGCETNAEAEQTVSGSVTTAAEQTEQAIETTQSVTEARFEAADFVYPDYPLTAENLLKITTAAKAKLVELGETSSPVSYYKFGLLDVDFDGFPELFCEFFNGSQKYHYCHLYSLKEENFCEKLLEYRAHFETVSSNTVYLKKRVYGGENSIVVYSCWDYDSHGVSYYISEIKNQNNNFAFEEKFYSHWDLIYSNDDTGYEINKFEINGQAVELEQYEKEYMDYMHYDNEVLPVDYVYEDIYYTSGNTFEQTEEYYDELYSLYSVYVNNLKKQDFAMYHVE